jgi:two-component system LytT family response regulator
MDGLIRVVIVDDEALARSKIRVFLERARNARVVAECGTVDEAVAAIVTLSPDVVFLDVQMQGGTGFDVIDQVGHGRMPVTVFVTAYDEHAVRAFEVHAVDYLLKPFDETRLLLALGRARRLVEVAGANPSAGELRAAATSEYTHAIQYPLRLVVRVDGGYGFVRTADIEWIEAADNYVVLHLQSGTVMVRRSLAKILAGLNPEVFVRVHRSAIINVEKVRLVQVYSGTEYQLVLDSGAKILTGRLYREQVRAAILQSSPVSKEEDR